MRAERAEWKAARAESREARTAETLDRMLRQATQAEVAAEQLTGDPHWKVYQQILSGSRKTVSEHRAGLVAQLASPRLVDHERMIALKILIAECDGMLAAWETAITLPKALKEDAETAAEHVEKQLEKQLHGVHKAG